MEQIITKVKELQEEIKNSRINHCEFHAMKHLLEEEVAQFLPATRNTKEWFIKELDEFIGNIQHDFQYDSSEENQKVWEGYLKEWKLDFQKVELEAEKEFYGTELNAMISLANNIVKVMKHEGNTDPLLDELLKYTKEMEVQSEKLIQLPKNDFSNCKKMIQSLKISIEKAKEIMMKVSKAYA